MTDTQAAPQRNLSCFPFNASSAPLLSIPRKRKCRRGGGSPSSAADAMIIFPGKHNQQKPQTCSAHQRLWKWCRHIEPTGLPSQLSGYRVGAESACRAGDPSLTPGSGRFPGEGNGHSLQYSCLENPTDRGAWRATVYGVAKCQTWLSDLHTHTFYFMTALGLSCDVQPQYFWHEGPAAPGHVGAYY